MQLVLDGYSPQGRRAVEAYLSKFAFKWDGNLYTIKSATKRGRNVVMDMDKVGALQQSSKRK